MISSQAGILEVGILMAVSGQWPAVSRQVTGRLFLGFLHCWLSLGFATAFWLPECFHISCFLVFSELAGGRPRCFIGVTGAVGCQVCVSPPPFHGSPALTMISGATPAVVVSGLCQAEVSGAHRCSGRAGTLARGFRMQLQMSSLYPKIDTKLGGGALGEEMQP